MIPYYQDKFVTIYYADCKDILPSLPNNSIDLVLTSPPFDDLQQFTGCDWDFKAVANLLWRVIAIGGVIVWIVSDVIIEDSETGSSFRQALYFKEIGFKLLDTMIYRKESMLAQDLVSLKTYLHSFEYMFILSKGLPKTFNPISDSGNRRPNIWFYTKNTRDAILPKALVSDCIVSWSNPGDIVLDPFLGTGTTAIVAKELKRKCIGIEIKERCCKIATKSCSREIV